MADMSNKHMKAHRIARVYDLNNCEFIDDASEAYGDWPTIDEPCDRSPSGFCEYAAREPDTCIHCGRKT